MNAYLVEGINEPFTATVVTIFEAYKIAKAAVNSSNVFITHLLGDNEDDQNTIAKFVYGKLVWTPASGPWG